MSRALWQQDPNLPGRRWVATACAPRQTARGLQTHAQKAATAVDQVPAAGSARRPIGRGSYRTELLGARGIDAASTSAVAGQETQRRATRPDWIQVTPRSWPACLARTKSVSIVVVSTVACVITEAVGAAAVAVAVAVVVAVAVAVSAHAASAAA